MMETIDKVTKFRNKEYQNEIKVLEKEIICFEMKYDMTTKQFSEDFESGKLGDRADNVEWSSLHKIHQRILERKNIFEGK